VVLISVGGRNFSVGMATGYGLDGPGIDVIRLSVLLNKCREKKNPGGGKFFRTRPDRSWGPPSLLYNGYRVFPGGKAAGAWC
jgi:hypothetical protein